MFYELLVPSSLYLTLKAINWGWCTVKKISISDNIEIARRGSGSDLVLKYLRKAKSGMEVHQKKGHPWIIKRRYEDMGTLYEILCDLISDLEKNPENVTQVKQKLALSGIDFESIVKKNHYYSFESPAIMLTFTTELILFVIIISIFTQFLISISLLL